LLLVFNSNHSSCNNNNNNNNNNNSSICLRYGDTDDKVKAVPATYGGIEPR